MNKPMRSIVRALTSCLALAACSVPATDSYVGGKSRLPALDLGENSARETCSLQHGSSDAAIYCGNELTPAGHVITPESADDPTTFLSASGWRGFYDSRFQCGTPVPATIYDSPAAALSCTGRQSPFPRSVLAVRIGRTLYVADGGKPIETILPRAIGVMSGKVAATPTAPEAANGLASERDAARAANTRGAVTEPEFRRQMANGALENQRGNYAASEAAYRSAVAILAQLVGRDKPALAVPVARQALQVSNLGRFTEADGLFARADSLAALPDQIDPDARPMVAYMKALHELNRNKPAEALALLDQAEQGFTANIPPDALTARNQVSGGASSAVEQIAQAAMDQSQIADRTGSDAVNGMIETRRYRAIALAELGRTQEAKDALKQESDLYAGRDPRMMARYYRTGGMAAAADKNSGGAISQLGLAVNTFVRWQPGTWPLAETELLRASRYGVEDSYADALPSCRDATSILRTLTNGVAPNLLIPCLHALSMDVPHRGQDVLREMFALSQLAQGSITSRQIAMATARATEGANGPNVAEAIRQYERATDHLEALYQKRAAMAGETNAAGALASLDEEIRKAQDAQRDAGEARQAAAPGFGALVQFSVSAEAVQALLKPGEAVAVTVLGDAEGWTLLVRKDRIFAGRIAGGAERIDALVKRFRAAMEVDAANHPGPFDAEAAFGLYNAVLGPVADGMTGVTALNVATSGSLLSVPFGALLTSPLEKDADLAAAKFLIEGVTVSHTPSAAGFVNLRSSVKTVQANRPWFGMGDFKPPSLAQAAKAFPVKPCGASAQELADLAPLPADLSGLDAARAILHAGAEDQLLGSAFTAGNVVAHPLSDYRMIHFATHAVLPGELECLAEPAILTSTAPNAPDVSGSLLTASQIESMHLDAELVILAACNTGGPNGTAAGESLSGLARAFFYAGARSLLVTHWDANAKTTTYLTARFLEALQAQPEAGPAAALAASQRRMLAEAKGDRAYQVHPYYWAVAALIGGRGAGVPASGS